MVLAPLLILGLVGVGLFVFKDKIASFASGGLTDAGKNIDQFGKDTQANIDQIGKDIGQFGKDQQANFDKFVIDTQKGIDKSFDNSQANINQFFKDADTNFNNNIAGIKEGFAQAGTGITTGVSNTNKAIDQFGKDVQSNIITGVSGIQQGFEDFISNPFGGQTKAKQIPKVITRPVRGKSAIFTAQPVRTNEKLDILINKDRPLTIGAIKPIPKEQAQVIKTQQGGTIDLSFLTPNTSLKSEILPQVKKTQRATRFSR